MCSMYNVIKKILKEEEWRKEENSKILEITNEFGIDTSKLYLGHVVLVDECMKVHRVINPFKIFSDCSLSFISSKMYWDFINQEVFAEINGFDGDLFQGESNVGYCVDYIQVLSEVTNKGRMTFEELNLFISNYNKENGTLSHNSNGFSK